METNHDPDATRVNRLRVLVFKYSLYLVVRQFLSIAINPNFIIHISITFFYIVKDSFNVTIELPSEIRS